MLILKSFFSTTSSCLSRYPPLQKRISRAAHEKNLLKIQKLKEKLGPFYRICGRERRSSPITMRNSSTRPSQKPVPPPTFKMKSILASVSNPQPLDIIPGNLDATLKMINSKTDPTSSPAPTEPLETRNELKAFNTQVECVASQAPFYGFNISHSQAKLLFEDTPKALGIEYNSYENSESMAEALKNMTSLENANGSMRRKFNIARIIELLGKTPHDTASPEVQAAIFSLRIRRFLEHLSENRHDQSMKRSLQLYMDKRSKILKYLRRKNLPRFIQTCDLIGVDPNTIRA